jgi:hypothetical protein
MRLSVVMIWVGLAAMAAGALGGRCAEPAGVDKSGYSPLNPTPREWMRPMTIDGPGATESPYTVDAGHFQMEVNWVSYSTYKGRVEGVKERVEQWSIGPVTLKAGLWNALDAQLVLEPYHRVFEREEDGFRETREGFGDTTWRVKYNVWGNDGGRTALGVVPYVIFPTSGAGVGNRDVQGGVLAPLNVELPGEFHLGVTAGVGSAQNEFSSRGRHAAFRNSAALFRELFWGLEGYVEYFSLVSTERRSPRADTVGGGLSYWLTEDLQLNGGVSRGVTRGADDWALFFGAAWRY